MELIIEFYKGLDTLNLIIFWGIIIVIILLLIFSCILISKNKKLKKMVDYNNLKFEEELPIKKESNPIIIENSVQEPIEQTPEIKNENINIEITNQIETENKFIAEEHIMDYHKESSQLENANNENKYSENNRVINVKSSIELPTAPYQRNVLREMSLSQTSPIGINRQEKPVDKKIEIAKDLEESLKEDNKELNIEKKSDNFDVPTKTSTTQIKEELRNIENNSFRKTEIISNNKLSDNVKTNEKTLITPLHEINNIDIKNNNNIKEKSTSEKYLEEVSRKLAEAEIPDEIERTDYELQQEEDAIISYKELMEKKDSIQTIDEEDAIISIEELIERNNQKEELIPEDSKLYNLTEDEENENFINELKQFRNDL